MALLRLAAFVGPALAKLNVAHLASDVERFPIITGCLDACGNELPACVTQCQVCVESNKCRTVEIECETCLQEVEAARADARNSSDLSIDSGGQSLIHDGLRTKLYAMKREQLSRQRELLTARDEVLTAQRQAEFADGRRAMIVAEIAAAREKKHASKGRVLEWEEHHESKVEDLEARKAELKEQREERHAQLKEAQDELRVAKNATADADEEHLNETKADEQAIRDRIHTLKQEIKDLKAEEAKIESRTNDKKKDAAWVDRELKKDAEASEVQHLEAKSQLRNARALERHAEEVLDSAKNRYRKVAAERAHYDDKVEELEAKLQANPLPTYIPKHLRTTPTTTTTNMWTPAEEPEESSGAEAEPQVSEESRERSDAEEVAARAEEESNNRTSDDDVQPREASESDERGRSKGKSNDDESEGEVEKQGKSDEKESDKRGKKRRKADDEESEEEVKHTTVEAEMTSDENGVVKEAKAEGEEVDGEATAQAFTVWPHVTRVFR